MGVQGIHAIRCVTDKITVVPGKPTRPDIDKAMYRQRKKAERQRKKANR